MNHPFKTSLLLFVAICLAADASVADDGSCPCESQSVVRATAMPILTPYGGAMPVSYQPATSGGVAQLSPDQTDYSQFTLTEDWFLNPELGYAALHLDVPYDADVEVSHPYLVYSEDGEEVCWHTSTVRSRGRYRHLVLSNMPVGKRARINVTATRWTKDPTCKAEPDTVCRSVFAMAGDRKWVTIDSAAFDAKSCDKTSNQTPLASACMFVSMAGAAQPAEEAEPAKTEEAKSTVSFGTSDLLAFVAYKTNPTDGGVAESFTFARHDDAPNDLKLTHKLGNQPYLKLDGDVEVTFTLDLKWQYPEGADAENPKKFNASVSEKLKLGLKYDSKKKEGTAKLSFARDSALRTEIEKVLPPKLSKAYPITTIEMTGSIKTPSGPEFMVTGPIKIKVQK